MPQRYLFICAIFLFSLGHEIKGQPHENYSVKFIKKNIEALPGQIVNIPFFVKNNTKDSSPLTIDIKTPENWKKVTKIPVSEITPEGQKFAVASVQIPSGSPVGNYTLSVVLSNENQTDTFAVQTIEIKVSEIENVTLELIESPRHIFAGEVFKSKYLVKNLGNTPKRVFIETSNCDIEGMAEIKLDPGQSSEIKVFKSVSSELTNVKKEFYTVRTLLSGKVVNSDFRSFVVFPVKNSGQDLFFRFPVTFAATYLASNQGKGYESAYQFELSGSGALDPEGRHQLDFLARGPNRSDLNFLGMYDQYYVSYANKNVELTVGERSYSFTPLTESSRFGIGVENKIKLNNGLSFGFLYVKPRFYSNISNEMSIYAQFEKKKAKIGKNSLGLFYILKNNNEIDDQTFLGSINAKLEPFQKTLLDIEASRGVLQGRADNALRTNINSQLWIFRLAGNYFYTGKYYPGYYSNSTFYSGTLSAQVSQKISAGIYSRQDFRNAKLDTFFVTAPYSRSVQSFINYNLSPNANLKFYWREYERKDRLSMNKFHYKTKSVNTHFNHKFKKIDYALLGEYGETVNLLQSSENKQNTYRTSVNFAYRFNSFHAIRFFGTWSNINSFVADDQRNLTAGMTINSQIAKSLKANFHIQNAFDIDDYYRNRNLMQLNLEYKFLKMHEISLRSYYTIFRGQVKDPEFTLSATYSYTLGVPLKQLIKAGDVVGRITNDNEEPIEGIIINLLNKSAITNKNGEFWFRSIQPGVHLLTIDPSGLEVDEMPGIPAPIEIEVIEDTKSNINIRITKGAKLTGKFVFENDYPSKTDELPIALKNIIVELKSDFELYRTVCDEQGIFSFPFVLPGSWTFRVYANSLPPGFEIEKEIYNFIFAPGEKPDLQVSLKPRKRNIIFNSQNISLSAVNTENKLPVKQPVNVKNEREQKTGSTFYSVQVGAFRKTLKPGSSFFKEMPFDFELQIDNLYRYFIGRYNSYNEAVKENEKIKKRYKGSFVVVFKNGKMLNSNNELK